MVDKVMDKLGSTNEVTLAAEQERVRKEEHDLLNAKLRPLVQQSFHLHDTNNDGTLSVEESRVFFRHYHP
eukprot:gene505-3299_t